jgi:hypothetical protein
VTDAHVVLEDALDGAPRTTETLLASLVVRVRTLGLVTGAQAVGSLVAGVAALGHEVSEGVEGRRMRRVLEQTRPGINAETLWSSLELGHLASLVPPSPVLEDLRNDMALLLADDLTQALATLDELSLESGIGLVREPRPFDVLDFLVGLSALGGFVADALEQLSAGNGHVPDEDAADTSDSTDGPVLR